MLNFSRLTIVAILAVCLFGILAALPNAVSSRTAAQFPPFLPSKQLTLGLDLQGGAQLLLQVETEAIVADRLQALADDMDTELREAGIRARRPSIEDRTVTVSLRSPADAEQAEAVLETLERPIAASAIGPGIRPVEVVQVGNQVRATLTEAGLARRIQSAINQSVEVVRRRIDALGTREPVIQKSGQDRILVQVPGIGQGEIDELKALLNAEARLTFHMVREEADPNRPPPGTEVLISETGGPIVIERRARLTGDNLQDAQPGFHPEPPNRPIVNFEFDFQGSRIFAELTARNVGRRFAIVLDEEVISAPVIQSAIRGGSGFIEGNFTVESSTQLAALLRAGALPAPLEVVEERTVGPDLGADSIRAGKIAAVIGLIAVIVYILISYGLFGLAANVALLINVALIIGFLSLLGATLTLPGIAGIVLTIGMAVDANVLVFERIREEKRAGKKPFSAVDNGYRQALSTILDANITTLIAALILFQFGSGPVKGFAVTLGIGILTSLFTAFVVTRLFVSLWLKRARPAALPI